MNLVSTFFPVFDSSMAAASKIVVQYYVQNINFKVRHSNKSTSPDFDNFDVELGVKVNIKSSQRTK